MSGGVRVELDGVSVFGFEVGHCAEVDVGVRCLYRLVPLCIGFWIDGAVV